MSERDLDMILVKCQVPVKFQDLVEGMLFRAINPPPHKSGHVFVKTGGTTFTDTNSINEGRQADPKSEVFPVIVLYAREYAEVLEHIQPMGFCLVLNTEFIIPCWEGSAGEAFKDKKYKSPVEALDDWAQHAHTIVIKNGDMEYHWEPRAARFLKRQTKKQVVEYKLRGLVGYLKDFMTEEEAYALVRPITEKVNGSSDKFSGEQRPVGPTAGSDAGGV